MTQILQAFGGGFASVCAQVGAQASVSHKYVAMATAVVLLVTELGGAIGSAIGAFLPCSFAVPVFTYSTSFLYS